MLPVMVTPRPGLIDVHPVHWLKATPSADGLSLTVSFWGGPCVAVDNVAVAETAATITVTLYEGTPPSDVHAACPELAVLQGVRVELQSPVAGRTIVDGAPEHVPPASPPVGNGIGGSPGASVPPDAPAA